MKTAFYMLLGSVLALGACGPVPPPPVTAAAEKPADPSPAPAAPVSSGPTRTCDAPPDFAKLPGVPAVAEPGAPGWVTQPSCLLTYDVVVGKGAQPKSRLSTVRVHYTGYLLDGTKFDSSVDRGKAFDTRLSQVVPGWTEGLLGMKAGGKRKLVIPAYLGYGNKGQGPIPANATLVFDVELLDVLVE